MRRAISRCVMRLRVLSMAPLDTGWRLFRQLGRRGRRMSLWVDLPSSEISFYRANLPFMGNSM
jgi:hypothetical protein